MAVAGLGDRRAAVRTENLLQVVVHGLCTHALLRPLRQMHAGGSQQHLHVAGPADRHHRDHQRVFQQQVPADDPGDEFAEHRVAVGIGAAGDRDQPGELGIAQRGAGTAQSRDDEAQRHRRAGIGCRLLAGQHEDADADDAADADCGELPQAQHAAEIATQADLCLQLLDRLVARQLAEETHCLTPRKPAAIIANASRHTQRGATRAHPDLLWERLQPRCPSVRGRS